MMGSLNPRAPKSQLDVKKAKLTSAEAVLDAVKAQLKVTLSGIEAAEADYNKTQVALERTSIFNPFDGVITRLNVDEGDYFTQGAVDPHAVLPCVDLQLHHPGGWQHGSQRRLQDGDVRLHLATQGGE